MTGLNRVMIGNDEYEISVDSELDKLLPRSAANMVVISSHSATTSGSLTSPPA